MRFSVRKIHIIGDDIFTIAVFIIINVYKSVVHILGLWLIFLAVNRNNGTVRLQVIFTVYLFHITDYSIFVIFKFYFFIAETSCDLIVIRYMHILVYPIKIIIVIIPVIHINGKHIFKIAFIFHKLINKLVDRRVVGCIGCMQGLVLDINRYKFFNIIVY